VTESILNVPIVDVAVALDPTPFIVTVGAFRYPEPAFVIAIPVIVEPPIVDVAAALYPSPLNVTVGGYK
jgi:hypothetical protein